MNSDTDSGKFSDWFKKVSVSPTPEKKIPKIPINVNVPIGKEEIKYKMTHEVRGHALIFNHVLFDPGLNKSCRAPGTNEDAERLDKTFKGLGFEVTIVDKPELTIALVKSKLKEFSCKDFKKCDCLIIVVLSHGKTDRVLAYDGWYPTKLLTEYFTSDKCPDLAGKPKIFVFNICQGDEYDVGVNAKVETDGCDTNGNVLATTAESLTYSLPLSADFLYAYSTVTGYVSFRDQDGSWYIKSLCEIFDEFGTGTEISTLLTLVSNKVALNYETKKLELNYQHLKQMPYFTSMLTRLLIFPPKVNSVVE